MAAVRGFFESHPGGSRQPPGLGRAVLDFVGWALDSGRVADTGGSAWWKTVNGLLVADLGEAGAALPAGAVHEGPVAAWVRYTNAPVGEEQAALWAAHEASITFAVEHAQPLLGAEEPPEQAFAGLVLRILRRATRDCEPTDTPVLGAQVRRLYPHRYPITQEELEAWLER